MNAADFPHLGIAETVERLDAMPELLETVVSGARPEDLTRQPGEGLFSLVEHACHLRDLEREGYLVRVRRMLTEAGFTRVDIVPKPGSRELIGQWTQERSAGDFVVSALIIAYKG